MTIYAKRQSTTKRITKSDCEIILKWLRVNQLDGVIVRRQGVEFGLDNARIFQVFSVAARTKFIADRLERELYQWLKGCTIRKTTIDSLVDDLFYGSN